MAAITPVTPQHTKPAERARCGGAAVMTTTSRDGMPMRLSRLVLPVLCVVVACVCASLLFVSVASALEVHEPVGSFGVSGPGSAGFSTVQGVAVDRSSGDVFVYDNDELTGGSVYKFNAAGEPAEFSGFNADVIPGVGFAGFNAVQELAISEAGATKGDLYAANGSTVNIYSSTTGEKLGELNSEVPLGAPWGSACGVAVDRSGNVFVGLESGSVNRYVPSGEVVKNEDWSSSLWHVPYEACNLAVDEAQDTYVNAWENENGQVHKYPISEYHAAEETAGPGTVAAPQGSAVAVDPVNNDLYVDEHLQVSEFEPSGALLSVIGGGAVAHSFGVATAGADGKLYVANKSNVAIFGPGETPPPAVSNSTPIYNLTRSSVVLKASASGRGSALTGCRFEYGPTTAYGSGGACEHLPNTGGEPVLRVDGLTPGTAYHFRLDAESAVGSTNGPDATFTTPDPPPATCTNGALRTGPSASLPDCRAYEQVSPTDKGGADIFPSPNTDRLSTDGTTATFASVSGFADVEGVPGMAEYLATRTSTGWDTHGITPKQASLGVGTVTTDAKPSYRRVAPDLGSGVFLALSPLTEYGGTANVSNLYVRRDLKDAGPGAYELASLCPACDAAGGHPLEEAHSLSDYEEAHYYIAGTSADFRHIVFVTRENLTSDAPGNCPVTQGVTRQECPYKVYDAHDGTVSLASILPDGSVAPKADAGAGVTTNDLGAPRVVSSDGSRIIFTDTSTGETLGTNEGVLSGQGGAAARGDIYERVDGTSTVQINASERSVPDAHAQAQYFDASADGTRVFFTTSQSLTEDAPAGGGLYLWDATAPEGHRLTFIATPNSNPRASIGTSSDGHYLYFMTTNGAIYVWHDGGLRYIEAGLTGANNESMDEASSSESGRSPNEAQVSPDGQHLLFGLARGLLDIEQSRPPRDPNPLGYEQNGHAEMYVYDYANNSLVCASCNPSGAPASGDARSRWRVQNSVFQGSDYLTHAMSEDGRFVFFTSEEALVPQDNNHVSDAYEYDTATGRVRLLSTGASPEPSVFLDATPDGANAMIDTFQPLVGQDLDTNDDAYDARVNGGIAAQDVAAAETCTEPTTCQGPESPPQAPAAPGSVTFMGPGDPALQSEAPTKPSVHVSVLGKRLLPRSLVLTVTVSAPGRMTVTGAGVVRLTRSLAKAGRYRISVGLTGAERRMLRSHHPRLRVRVALAAADGSASANVSIAAGR
jgi:hypothetical protein